MFHLFSFPDDGCMAWTNGPAAFLFPLRRIMTSNRHPWIASAGACRRFPKPSESGILLQNLKYIADIPQQLGRNQAFDSRRLQPALSASSGRHQCKNAFFHWRQIFFSNRAHLDLLRATRSEICPAEQISWLAVKEAANREEKNKESLKKGSLDKDPVSITGSGSSVQLMNG